MPTCCTTRSRRQCVRVKSGSEDDAEWEGGNNHRLRVPSDGAEEVSVLLKWGSGQLTVDGVPAWSGQVAPTPEAPGGNSSSDDEDGGSDGRSDYSSATSSWDDSMLRPQWQGKELRFMQSNEHTRCVGGAHGWGAAWLGGRPEPAGLPGAKPATCRQIPPARLLHSTPRAASARACGTRRGCAARRCIWWRATATPPTGWASWKP